MDGHEPRHGNKWAREFSAVSGVHTVLGALSLEKDRGTSL